jgi:hypothetical protein
MAQTATVVSQQTLQFDTGAQTRVFVTTGIAQFNMQAFSQNPNNQSRQSDVVKLLVDPVLAPGQFRKAAAMVSFANVQRNTGNVAEFTQTSWAIDDIACSLDDESGKVELRFQVTIVSSGTNASTGLSSAAFQVTSVATL